jgi:hypothetical protein
LFYTRKDEEGGRGYEFLHKSFGEYLTARGLMSAFRRWGDQVDNPALDFSATEFMRRWLRLTGAAPMTREILNFLRNEAHLLASALEPNETWVPARNWVRTAERLVDAAMREGVPAHEGATTWRVAENQEKNAEISLIGLLDACARSAYPSDRYGASASDGGWEAGPVHVAAFESDLKAFGECVKRLADSRIIHLMMMSDGWVVVISPSIILQVVSRLSLRGVHLVGHVLSGASLEGVDLRGSILMSAQLSHTDLSRADLRGADLRGAQLVSTRFTQSDLRGALLEGAEVADANLESAKTDGSSKGAFTSRKGSGARGGFRLRW